MTSPRPDRAKLARKIAWLLSALTAFAGAPALAGSFPLGVYVGNADGNDAAAMARFKHSFDAHVEAMGGARPRYFNVFTDFREDPSRWAASAAWAAWSSKRSGDAYLGPGSGMIPVVGVPLASGRLGWSKVDGFYRDVVAGKYDDAWTGIVRGYAKAGYKTVDFRIAYEMNGNFMPWAPANSKAPEARANFVAAFRHVADIIHREGKEQHIKALVHWNPTAINDSGFDVAQLYPGDRYVDVIAVDIYSTIHPLDLTDWASGGRRMAADRASWVADPANRRHHWLYPNASQRLPAPRLGNWGWSIAQAIDFALAHRLPLGLDETGAGPARGALGVPDDAEFPRFLARTLAAAQARGLVIRNVNIWDVSLGDGSWQFHSGRQPKAAAAWAECFGGPPGRPGAQPC